MNAKIPAMLLGLGLLAGCGSGTSLRILRPTTAMSCTFRSTSSAMDGKASAERKEGVRVETVGKDTVVTWLETGQAFVFKDLSGYWGTLALDEADLWIDKVRIRVDSKRLRVECPDAHAEAALSRIPKEQRMEIRISPGLVSIQPA